GAGGAGVLPRSAGAAELRVAIDAMLHGLAVAPAGGLWGADEEDERRLTARELEVLKLLAEGASNKMIARQLAVSVHTAKFHVASILEKLDATGRTDAVAHAVRLRLLMPLPSRAGSGARVGGPRECAATPRHRRPQTATGLS